LFVTLHSNLLQLRTGLHNYIHSFTLGTVYTHYVLTLKKSSKKRSHTSEYFPCRWL